MSDGRGPSPDLFPAGLPAGGRAESRGYYESIRSLPASQLGLDGFLAQFLADLAALMNARQGAIWIRLPGSHRIQCQVRWTSSDQPLQPTSGADHESLVQYAWRQNAPLLLSPAEAPPGRTELQNPFDAPLLLAPIHSQEDPIALIELVLSERWPEGEATEGRAALEHLLDLLRTGLEQRFFGNLAPLQPALINLAATRAEIEAFQRAIVVSLEITLNGYAGWNFGSLQNNRTFVRSVHELLDANGLRVECPECGAPAILRCQAAGNSKTGVFLYDHYLETGRTFHGGRTTFPEVKLVAKPPRRRPS